jgi:CBS domain-containing protein
MLPTVRTFMDTDTHAVLDTLPILDAVRTLVDKGVTGVPVVQDGRLVGVLGERECLRLVAEGDNGEVAKGKVSDFMRPLKEPLIHPDMDIYYVAGLFLSSPTTRRFPVVQGDRLVGVITRKDILRALLKP